MVLFGTLRLFFFDRQRIIKKYCSYMLSIPYWNYWSNFQKLAIIYFLFFQDSWVLAPNRITHDLQAYILAVDIHHLSLNKTRGDHFRAYVHESSAWCWVIEKGGKKILVNGIYRSTSSTRENDEMLLKQIRTYGDRWWYNDVRFALTNHNNATAPRLASQPYWI